MKSPSLRAIESATFDVRAAGSGSGVLTLARVPTILTKWLIPRLSDFRQHYPGVTFSFCRHLDRGETQPHDIDASIRYGSGDWEDPPEIQEDQTVPGFDVQWALPTTPRDFGKYPSAVFPTLQDAITYAEQAAWASSTLKWDQF